MRPQSILFGNGLNLLNEGTLSWDNLLKDIVKDKLDKDIPYTLKYEAAILKRPYREDPVLFLTADNQIILTADKKVFMASGDVIEYKLKKDIAERVSTYEPNDIYRMVSELPVAHFMTTNYDNTLLKVIGENTIMFKHRQEQNYSIRRHYTLIDGKQYWPIHGNVDSPRSIMLGFDHYCGALSNEERYVKGGYEIPEIGRVSSITKRLEDGIKNTLSWIDLFYSSDVHIIGQGLNYAEMDLWWILNKRRRIKQRDANLINNRIIYYPDYSLAKDKRQLLNGFDVDICDLEDYPEKERFLSYSEQLNNMKLRMAEAD